MTLLEAEIDTRTGNDSYIHSVTLLKTEVAFRTGSESFGTRSGGIGTRSDIRRHLDPHFFEVMYSIRLHITVTRGFDCCSLIIREI